MVEIVTSVKTAAGGDIRELLTKASTYLSTDKIDVIQKAYEFARVAHHGQQRLSGAPFLEHPLRTARFLADLRLDSVTLAAALLHDVMEDCDITHDTLVRGFGSEIANLVDGVTKLNKMNQLPTDQGHEPGSPVGNRQDQAESLRKMLVAMAGDIRVVLIKLSDRLHNMRTLGALPHDRRAAIAQETLDIYAPLAHRLGMLDMKWRLEDQAFRFLNPTKYRQISRLLAGTREERERYIQQTTSMLKQELEQAGVKAEVTGRPKHIYSVYQKMQLYTAQGKEFSEIYDLFALRVLVKEIPECYSALGIVHNLWHPILGQFDDYIASSKKNLYQSLHTTVRCIGGVPIEIQIRTRAMDRICEYGVASHWRYKEGNTRDMRFEEKMAWLRQLLEWQREMSGAEEFLQSVKMDIFHDQVFVYTPTGDIRELPTGSTPIDFAYRIHTNLGHCCIGAKVNGKLVPVDYKLQNGDTVEVLAAKVTRGPSLDWLNPDMEYTKTANAQARIRQWFRKQERSTNIKRGRDLLHKEQRRMGFSVAEEEVAQHFRYETLDDFLVALGSGGVSLSQMASQFAADGDGEDMDKASFPIPRTGPASGLQVLGVGEMPTHIGHCCSPFPDHEIVGFITRSHGVTVHRKDCLHVANKNEPRRMVQVEWGQPLQLHPARVTIEALDRVGLLRDVTSLVSAEGVNISSVATEEHHNDDTASIHLTLFTTGMGQLGRLLAKLEGVRSVVNATRSTAGQIQIKNSPTCNVSTSS